MNCFVAFSVSGFSLCPPPPKKQGLRMERWSVYDWSITSAHHTSRFQFLRVKMYWSFIFVPMLGLSRCFQRLTDGSWQLWMRPQCHGQVQMPLPTLFLLLQEASGVVIHVWKGGSKWRAMHVCLTELAGAVISILLAGSNCYAIRHRLLHAPHADFKWPGWILIIFTVRCIFSRVIGKKITCVML